MLKDSRIIAAILAADVVDYSRLMGTDEAGTLAALKSRRAIFDELVAEFGGRQFGSVGDSLMAEFPSAVNSVSAAIAIQQRIAAENAPLPATRRMQLRIGVNLGDVIKEHGDVFGDAVNVAARLQALAKPGGIVISGSVYEQVRLKLSARFINTGSRQVKNIREPVRTYDVLPEEPSGSRGRRMGWVARIPSWRVARSAIAVAAVAAAVALAVNRFSGDASGGYDRARDGLPIVQVLPPANLTGEPTLDWLGKGLAVLVMDELARSRQLIVSATPTRPPGEEPVGPDAVQTATGHGVSHVMEGEILETPSGLALTVRMRDVRSSQTVAANRYVGAGPKELLGLAPSIALLAKQGLDVPRTEQVDVFAAGFAAAHTAAYEAYVNGLEFFVNFRYEEALRSFELAVQTEPAFAMARYRLAQTLASSGDTDRALAELAIASRHASDLPDREQRYIEAAGSYFRRQYETAKSEYQSILNDYPYEREARQLLLYVLFDLREHEQALKVARELLLQEPSSPVVWGAIGELSLELGRFDEADAALTRFAALSPNNPNALWMRGESAFLQGDLAAGRKYFEDSASAGPHFGPAQLRLGHIDRLENNLEAALSRFLRLSGGEEFPPTNRIDGAFELAYLLRSMGQCRRAIAVLEQFEAVIVAEGVRQALSLSTRAQCLLDLGESAKARTLAADAVSKAPARATRYLFVQGLAERHAGDWTALERTIDAIRGLADKDSAEDRTEQKAADCLEGLRDLDAGDVESALRLLARATTEPGYEYDLYGLPYALARERSGDAPSAEELLRQVTKLAPARDLRLDLDRSRFVAELELARILARTGRISEATERAEKIRRIWSAADPGFQPAGDLNEAFPRDRSSQSPGHRRYSARPDVTATVGSSHAVSVKVR